ncbi:MAG: glycosyltransferase family 2 protein [Pirellulales bacterium]
MSTDDFGNINARRPPPGTTRLSVVMPVYNEAEVIEPLVEELTAQLDLLEVDYEIVFANDGSSDGSGALLDKLAARNRAIKVVHLARNFGHQAAVQAGLSRACGDCIVLMDSDLQDDPAAIRLFVDAWRDGCDVVYAQRTKRKESAVKRMLFGGFHWLLTRVADTPIPQDAGIFGLVDRRVADELIQLPERDRYLPGLRSWVGFRQQGIVVERRARYDEHPRVSLRGLCRLAKSAIFSFSSMPLAMFYLIGATAFAVFAALSGFAIFCKLFTDWAIPGWTSHVLTASFFGAVNALGISILGEYVTRIYDQVRGRPLFLVARTVNFGSEQCAAATDELNDEQLCEQLLEEAEAMLDTTSRVRHLEVARREESDPPEPRPEPPLARRGDSDTLRLYPSRES